MSDDAKQPESVWAVVELMGHVKLAGRLTEEEKFGAKLGRPDIPTMIACPNIGTESHVVAPDACPQCRGAHLAEGFITTFFIVTEAVARHIAPGDPDDGDEY